MRTYVGLFCIAALAALVWTPLVRMVAVRLRAYGPARDGRAGLEVPRLGGIAVCLASLASWGSLLFLHNDVRRCFEKEWYSLTTLVLPSAVVVLLGIYDDLKGTNAWQKLTVQTLAAALMWFAGWRILLVPLTGHAIDSPVLSFALTVFWIVAVTNAFNLIDGMDGLAPGIAFFVAISVFVVSLLQKQQFVCILAITLAGALLGFLKYNFAPARIYLGDTGSLFLGFTLACLAIRTSQKASTLLAIVVPFVAFGLPLFDTTLTVIRRALSGKRIFSADTNHTHHRLIKHGLSTREAVLVMYGVAALFSLGSLLILHSTGSLVALVAVLTASCGWFVASLLKYEELSEVSGYISRSIKTQRGVLVNEIAIRKAAHELLRTESVEDGWQGLGLLLEELGFDAAACSLQAWPNGSAPRLAPWPAARLAGPEPCMMVSAPLYANGTSVGELRLWRARRKGRTLFHFTALLEAVVPPLEKLLAERLGSQHGVPTSGSGDAPGEDTRPEPLAWKASA